MKKKYLLLSIVILITHCNFMAITGYCQAPNWTWVKDASVTGGMQGARGNSVATDAAGNIFVCGMFDNPEIIFGSNTLYDFSYDNIFVAKYDNNGTLLWAKNTGGRPNDQALGIATDASGSVYVTGLFCGSTVTFGSSTLINNGDNNYFIAKYDANGNVLWAKCAGGIGAHCGAMGIGTTVDVKGNVYAIGSYYGSMIIFNTDTIKNRSVISPVFLVKYDSNGNELWAKSSTDTGYGYSVGTDARCNAFITGFFTSSHIMFASDTLTNPASGENYDMFLVKYNENGKVIWARNSKDSGYTSAADVAVDANGNSYVTGSIDLHSVSFGNDTLHDYNFGWYIAYLVKYDSNGNALWAKGSYCPRASAAGAGGSGVTIAPGGNVYITGSFWNPYLAFGMDTLFNVTNYDIFIAGYDGNGNVLFDKSVGNSVSDLANSIATDATGSIYITGSYADTLAFGSNTIFSGGSDVYLAKLNPGLAGMQQISNKSEVDLYPNPNNGKFVISLNSGSEKSNMEIFNMIGQKIYTAKLNTSYNNIDMSNNTEGVYLYRIFTESGGLVSEGKFIIQKQYK